MRTLHAALFRRPLPDQIALYFHGLEPAEWESFTRLVQFLCKEQGYRVTDPLEFVAPSPHRRLLLSFDDNYMSWYEARRLFDRLGIRVTFYVNTLPFEYLEGSWELADYYERLRHSGPHVPLTRDALRALHLDGHTIGAHTHSHFMLTSLPERDAQEEIARNKELLERMLVSPVMHFAYPYGMRRHFTDSLRNRCLAQGFATVANGIPAMQHSRQRAESIQRSPWHLRRPLEHNLMNLRIDGRLFEHLTGRSAVG